MTTTLSKFKYLFVALLAVAIAFPCCQSGEDRVTQVPAETLPTRQSGKKISYTLDSCSISLDSTQMYAYDVYAAKGNLFIGFNARVYALDFFDLDKKVVDHQLRLQKDGPNGLRGHIQALSIINKDTLVLLAENNISFITSTGKLIREIRINTASPNKLFVKNNFFSFPSLNFHYDSLGRTAYVGNISYDYSQCDKKHFNAPLLGKVSGDGKEIDLLPVYYPAAFREKSFGFLFEYGSCFYNNFKTLAFNFASGAEIYTYDMETTTLRSYGGDSKFTKNQASGVDWKKCIDLNLKMKHIIENPRFYKVIHDPYRNLFYRFQTQNLPYIKKPNGLFPTSGEKEQYLTIFDSDFSVVDEIRFTGRKYYPDCAFVNSEGLWFSAPSLTNEDVLNFAIMKFQ